MGWSLLGWLIWLGWSNCVSWVWLVRVRWSGCVGWDGMVKLVRMDWVGQVGLVRLGWSCRLVMSGRSCQVLGRVKLVGLG